MAIAIQRRRALVGKRGNDNLQLSNRREYLIGSVLLLWSIVLTVCTRHEVTVAIPANVSTDQTLMDAVKSTTQLPEQVAMKSTTQLPNLDEKESILEELYRSVSPDRLVQLARTHRMHYKNASPFPHIAIDDIFPDSILQKVIEEHPESSMGKDGCLIERSICLKQATQNLKSAVQEEESMGMYTRVFFSFLKSSIFTKFLEGLTGIQNIIADPHFRGSGLHFTAAGGSLDIHADFNKYQEYNLDRRVSSCSQHHFVSRTHANYLTSHHNVQVNLFVYLNNDWPDEYGGHLDLWSRDMKTCYERISPKLGRFVVFSSTDFTCR